MEALWPDTDHPPKSSRKLSLSLAFSLWCSGQATARSFDLPATNMSDACQMLSIERHLLLMNRRRYRHRGWGTRRETSGSLFPDDMHVFKQFDPGAS